MHWFKHGSNPAQGWACLTVRTNQAVSQGWREGWWEAERGEALRQLEEVCDAPDAWQPAALVWDAPEEDLQPSSAPGCARPALLKNLISKVCRSLGCTACCKGQWIMLAVVNRPSPACMLHAGHPPASTLQVTG